MAIAGPVINITTSKCEPVTKVAIVSPTPEIRGPHLFTVSFAIVNADKVPYSISIAYIGGPSEKVSIGQGGMSFVFTEAGESYPLEITLNIPADAEGDMTPTFMTYTVTAAYAPAWASIDGIVRFSVPSAACCESLTAIIYEPLPCASNDIRIVTVPTPTEMGTVTNMVVHYTVGVTPGSDSMNKFLNGISPGVDAAVCERKTPGATPTMTADNTRWYRVIPEDAVLTKVVATGTGGVVTTRTYNIDGDCDPSKYVDGKLNIQYRESTYRAITSVNTPCTAVWVPTSIGGLLGTIPGFGNQGGPQAYKRINYSYSGTCVSDTAVDTRSPCTYADINDNRTNLSHPDFKCMVFSGTLNHSYSDSLGTIITALAVNKVAGNTYLSITGTVSAIAYADSSQGCDSYTGYNWPGVGTIATSYTIPYPGGLKIDLSYNGLYTGQEKRADGTPCGCQDGASWIDFVQTSVAASPYLGTSTT